VSLFTASERSSEKERVSPVMAITASR
jgi:hypothetical protein